MKATSLLGKQHRKVLAALKKLAAGRAEAGPLLAEIATELTAHMTIEQDIFYPAVREVDKDMVLESFEEHAIAELALKRLLASAPNDQAFTAKVEKSSVQSGWIPWASG